MADPGCGEPGGGHPSTPPPPPLDPPLAVTLTDKALVYSGDNCYVTIAASIVILQSATHFSFGGYTRASTMSCLFCFLL